MSGNQKPNRIETDKPAFKEDINIFELPLARDNETERALLSAILLDGALINQAMEMLEPDDIYNHDHRIIYQAMMDIAQRGDQIDHVTVRSELETTLQLEQIGGAGYLAQLIDGSVRVDNIRTYAKILQEKSQLRDLVKAGREIVASAALESDSLCTDLILRARQLVDNVAIRSESEGFTDITAIADVEIERLERIANTDTFTSGIPSGLTDLDRLTSGYQNDELILVAARPSVGKTSFALNNAEHAATAGYKVGFFSLEMPKRQLVMRLICGMARIDSHRWRGGYLNREEWARIGQARQKMADWKMQIDDSTGLTVPSLRAKARRLKAESGLDILFVDYLQKIKVTNQRSTREQEISEISSGLKDLAMELHIPVVALTQLSRAAEHRADHKPQLSDLREGGSQEADADMVILLYRPEMFADTASEENAGIAEAIIAKQRNGPTDTVRLTFIKQFTLFENLWRDQ